MKIYNYSKKRLTFDIIAYVLIITISSLYFKHNMNSDFAHYCVISLVSFGIYITLVMIKDYEFPLVLNVNYIELSVYGRYHKIDYNLIASIRHSGFSHYIFWDRLIIVCKDGKKICVESVYENYLELWNSIIEYAQKTNPNIEIHDSIKKRMKIQDNNSTN